MKKIFVFIFSLVLLCNICIMQNAKASIFEPQWSEFCPPKYQNAVFRKGEKPGMYKENNYWAVRRVQFEKSKRECRSYQDIATQNACYQRMVDIERNKSVQRKAAKAERYYEEDREIMEQFY